MVVSRAGLSVEITAEEDEQIRQRLAEYFAILREWDLRVRQTESQNESEFRQS
jgi:hypothetical protein